MNKNDNIDLKSRHVTPADGNVFADLGFPAEEAAALLAEADAQIAKAEELKQMAAMHLSAWMQSENLTQLAAAKVLKVSRPRVSDLANKKLDRFSLDSLVGMLLRTGRNVELTVR